MLEVTCRKSLNKFKKINNIGKPVEENDEDIKLLLK